jgi:transposase
VTSLPRTRVICIDELGPLAAKTYPGETWQTGPYRATFEPDYGRRGTLWVHGALEPTTGEATFLLSPRRDGATHIQLLEQMITTYPADRWLVIEDNLSIHKSRDVKTALLAWPEIQIQFLPKYAAWLNLIEPWWKQLRSLALKGKRFENVADVSAALVAALAYWNEHRHPYQWKKHPQYQDCIPCGGYSSAITYNRLST